MRLSVELLEALQDCIRTVSKLLDLLEEDREDMPACINGEILQEYLRGMDGARKLELSLLEDLHAAAEGI